MLDPAAGWLGHGTSSEGQTICRTQFLLKTKMKTKVPSPRTVPPMTILPRPALWLHKLLDADVGVDGTKANICVLQGLWQHLGLLWVFFTPQLAGACLSGQLLPGCQCVLGAADRQPGPGKASSGHLHSVSISPSSSWGPCTFPQRTDSGPSGAKSNNQ